jgi:hypothetical protein
MLARDIAKCNFISKMMKIRQACRGGLPGLLFHPYRGVRLTPNSWIKASVQAEFYVFSFGFLVIVLIVKIRIFRTSEFFTAFIHQQFDAHAGMQGFAHWYSHIAKGGCKTSACRATGKQLLVKNKEGPDGERTDLNGESRSGSGTDRQGVVQTQLITCSNGRHLLIIQFFAIS